MSSTPYVVHTLCHPHLLSSTPYGPTGLHLIGMVAVVHNCCCSAGLKSRLTTLLFMTDHHTILKPATALHYLPVVSRVRCRFLKKHGRRDCGVWSVIIHVAELFFKPGQRELPERRVDIGYEIWVYTFSFRRPPGRVG